MLELFLEKHFKAGLKERAPYLWVKAPSGYSSWDLFDMLLQKANVVGTPGSGFGSAGEGYFRISAFNSRKNVETAMQRIVENLQV